MAKVDGSLRSLIQGVSQQPARTRLPGQCTAQDNMSSNPVTGLTRRPAMQEIATLFSTASAVQFYDFELGDTNAMRFVLAATPGNMRIFDLDGNEMTVNNLNSAFNYLDGGNLAFTTLDDITYVANRSKVVAMDSGTQSYIKTGSFVYLLGGQYGRIYQINVIWSGGTISVSWTAPDGGSASHSTQITTTNIAAQLASALLANATFVANFTVGRADDVLYIKKTSSPTSQPFSVTVQDGDGGTNMLVINNSIKNAADLPRFAVQGYVVKVSGDAQADADDWYVQFIPDRDSAGNLPGLGNGFGRPGVWAECVAPDIPFALDKTTTPHVLTYDENTDQFNFDLGDWADREAGDEESNKAPTFVGRTIEDLAYFQSRLVMLSGPATIMSRTDKPLNFWLNSATILADTDRIDIQSTAKGVRSMLRSIPFNRDLVVFANKGQFIVLGRNQLTPKNASLILTTSFEADMTASPVPAGQNIFFGFKFGKFTGIREFFTESTIDANNARPITQHVNKYLEGNVRTLTSTSNFDILLVQTSISQAIMYVYEYTWLDEKKVQSSWSRWLMSDDVVYSFITESVINIVTRRNNNYILNRIDLDLQNDPALDYSVRLDRKIFLDNVNTTVVAPYLVKPANTPDSIIFIQGEGCPNPGMRVWVDSYNAGTDTYTFDRDMEGGTVIAGITYRSSYVPTNPDVKDQDGVRISTGKLKVSKFIVACKETGKMFARIFSKYFDDREVEFTARIVGDPETYVGEAAIIDNNYIVPFRENVDNAELELYSESHLPMTFTDIQWKGQYTKKGQRIATGGSL